MIYRAARKSTVRFIRDQIMALNRPIEYLDWDEASDIQKLPSIDLIGLNGFALTNDGSLHNLIFGVTFSSLNDNNLARITDYVDHFYDMVQPTKTFKLFNNQATQIGVVTFFEGASVVPVTRAEMRVTVSMMVSGSLVVN